MAVVRDSGHSWDTAKRLKKLISIESRKLSIGGPWMWLPAAVVGREHEGSEGSTENKALPWLPRRSLRRNDVLSVARKACDAPDESSSRKECSTYAQHMVIQANSAYLDKTIQG